MPPLVHIMVEKMDAYKNLKNWCQKNFRSMVVETWELFASSSSCKLARGNLTKLQDLCANLSRPLLLFSSFHGLVRLRKLNSCTRFLHFSISSNFYQSIFFVSLFLSLFVCFIFLIRYNDLWRVLEVRYWSFCVHVFTNCRGCSDFSFISCWWIACSEGGVHGFA